MQMILCSADSVEENSLVLAKSPNVFVKRLFVLCINSRNVVEGMENHMVIACCVTHECFCAYVAPLRGAVFFLRCVPRVCGPWPPHPGLTYVAPLRGA